MATPLPERLAGARIAARKPKTSADSVAAGATVPAARHNWPLYAFLFLLPLQNIQVGYLPKLPYGLNFLNIGFALALIGAWRMRGHISRWSSVHRWVWLYVFWSIATLAIGSWMYPDADTDRLNNMKDSLLGVLLLFVVEMSVTDWTTLKRVLLFMLLPLPYILRVAWAQHASVSSWHYNDDLRLQGTLTLLGANEFAAFCVTVALMLFALLLASNLSKVWRILLIGGITCMVFGILWAYSRTAYVAVLAGAAVILLAWRGRWKMLVPVLLALMVVPPLLPNSVSERFDSTHVEGNQVDESTADRYEFWHIAIQVWEKHPFVGVGNYTFSYVSAYKRDTHNLYVRTLAEKGVIGLIILIGLFFSFARAAWQTFRNTPPGTMAYALGLGMLGAWLALVIGNFWGDRFTYTQMIGYFWVFLGLMLKARDFAQAEAAESESQTVPAEPARVRRRYVVPLRATRREQLLTNGLASK